jgi:hypothetical protein
MPDHNEITSDVFRKIPDLFCRIRSGAVTAAKNIPKEASYLGLINSADKQAATAEIFLQRAFRLVIVIFFF